MGFVKGHDFSRGGKPGQGSHSRFSLERLCPIQAASFAAWVGRHKRSPSLTRTPSGNWLPRRHAVRCDSISTVPVAPVAYCRKLDHGHRGPHGQVFVRGVAVLRLRNQSALDWIPPQHTEFARRGPRIAMDIADHFGTGLLSVDIAVVITVLPELFARSSQLTRSHLLDGFQETAPGLSAAVH